MQLFHRKKRNYSLNLLIELSTFQNFEKSFFQGKNKKISNRLYSLDELFFLARIKKCQKKNPKVYPN